MATKPPSKTQRAGGCLLAGAIVIGATIGAVMHQPSLGAVIGVAVGLLLLAAVWLMDKRSG